MPLNQQILHVYVAMQNLAHGRAINDIAEEIGRSRFVTARMVRRARDMGLIEVRGASPIPSTWSSPRVRSGLRPAVVLVVATRATTDVECEAVAHVTARFVTETVEEDDVLGFTPDALVAACASSEPSRAPTSSSSPGSVATARRGYRGDLHAAVQQEERAIRCTCPSSSPRRLGDPPSPDGPGRLRTLQEHQQSVPRPSGWPSSSLLAQILEANGERRARGKRRGRRDRDESAGPRRSFRARSRGRFIGISEETLRAVPLRVGIGGGEGKHQAIQATLRSGLLHADHRRALGRARSRLRGVRRPRVLARPAPPRARSPGRRIEGRRSPRRPGPGWTRDSAVTPRCLEDVDPMST